MARTSDRDSNPWAGLQPADGDDSPPSRAEAPNAVWRRLARHGYALLTAPVAYDTFESVSRQLGDIALRTDLVVDPDQLRRQASTRQVGGRPSTYQSAALDFHTDNPLMNVLAWYCVEQDPDAGALLLIDTRDLTDHLPAADLAVLAELPIRFFHRPKEDAPEEVHETPVLERRGPGYRICYQPWHFVGTYDAAQRSALERLKAYLDGLEPRAIRLLPGQCLWIDNRRLLHGRAAIGARSRRHIVRFYLRTPEIPAA